MRAVFAHRRLREKPPSGGVSVYRESVAPDPSLVARAAALLAGLGWRGVAMVEMKTDARTGTPYLMEVNGRFWGSLQLAVDAGVDGIYCSNHGGRQANGGLPALDCLPGVVEAAGDLPVWFDSGVRGGAHVVKALALGATAIGVGRPYAYGLAVGGQAGIEHVLRCLLAETDLIMAVDGYPRIADLTPDALRRVGR